jgi:hypothetical protein
LAPKISCRSIGPLGQLSRNMASAFAPMTGMGRKAWLRRDRPVPVPRKEGLTQRRQRPPGSSAPGAGSEIAEKAGYRRFAQQGGGAVIQVMRRSPVVHMRHQANRRQGRRQGLPRRQPNAFKPARITT